MSKINDVIIWILVMGVPIEFLGSFVECFNFISSMKRRIKANQFIASIDNLYI